jgi:hypothetical protein
MIDIRMLYMKGDGNMLQNKERIGSYNLEDVEFLLKNISSMVEEKSTEEREKLIQSGVHYSEMLPIEYCPSKEYIDLFYKAMESASKKMAEAVGIVTRKIIRKNGRDLVLVSLARAGTPIGILIKRYAKLILNIDIPHYSISIIRGMGIDENALSYIQKHNSGKSIQFIDGWTGKGAISNELKSAVNMYNKKYNTNIDSDLAVLADPGDCAEIFGTKEDFLIPSACLNSTISGLVSRTFYRSDIIGNDEFHGVKFYEELVDEDLSNYYIDEISGLFNELKDKVDEDLINIESTELIDSFASGTNYLGRDDVKRIKEEYCIDNINLIKPGVGETTRVLLRRVPYLIFVKDMKNKNLEHIMVLAKEKGVKVIEYPLKTYLCCGIIKNLRSCDI